MWLLTFLALGAAGLLYFSFRKHQDDSARYMLIGQLTIAFSAGLFALSDSLRFDLGALHMLMINATIVVAELSTLFGLLALNRDVPRRWFGWAFIAACLWAGLLELLRPVIALSTLQTMGSTVAAILASLTLYLLLRLSSDRFRQHLFVRLVLISQVGVISFWVTRAMLVSNQMPVSVMEPSQLSTVLIIAYIAFLLVRVLAYLGIRVSWAMQDYRDANELNAELVNTMRQRDRFFNRLITTNKAIGLGAFAAALAHQMNQPLTALSMQASVLKRQLQSPIRDEAQLSAASQAIGGLSLKLTDLVRSLHSLFSNTGYVRQTSSLGDLANEVSQFLKPILAEQSIVLTLTRKANPLVNVSHSQVQQVFLNVINNAAAACGENEPGHRLIELVVEQIDAKAVLTVSDNGCGLSQAAAQQAFNLFDSSNPSGMGFGLWLSRTIMGQHDGEISINSHPDGGTTVTVLFPIVHSDESKQEHASPSRHR